MNVLATIRRKHRSAPLLSAVLLAWLSVLLAPCTMAMTVDQSVSDDVPNVGMHADCPDSKSPQSMTDLDCCCDLDAAMGIKAPELNKFTTVIAVPTVLTVVVPAPTRIVMMAMQRAPLHETSPPLYLSTQRLRI